MKINSDIGQKKGKVNKLTASLCDPQPDSRDSRIEPSSGFKRWLVRIRNSIVYKVFFVRALKSRISKCIYVLLYICMILGYVFFVNLLSPPLKFSELNIMQGCFEEYHRSTGSNSDTLIIRGGKGEIEKFKIHHDYEKQQKLSILKGELIKVYYRERIHFFLYPYKDTESITYKNKYIYEYSKDRFEREVMIYEAYKILFPTAVILCLILICIVYRRHRKN